MLADRSADQPAGIDEDDAPRAGDPRLVEPGRHFGGDFDAGEAGADHDHGAASFAGLTLAQRSQMRIELARGLIGVDVKTVRCQSRDRVPRQLAAERQHQPIAGQRFAAAGTRDGDPSSRGIDGFDLGHPVAHADGIKQLCQRDDGLAEIDFVIADADVVVGVAVDDENLDIARPRANLLAFARGADRRPQPRKAGPEDKNTRHVRSASVIERRRNIAGRHVRGPTEAERDGASN